MTTLAMESTSSGPEWLPKLGWTVMAFLAVAAGVHAFTFATVHAYGDASVKARMFTFVAVGAAHTLGGAFASMIGPFQFLKSIRRRVPRVHVWLGRIYLICVVSSAIASLVLSPNSFARNNGGIAFIFLALAWLYTAIQAYVSIRSRDVVAHRRWMICNFALTFAAPMLRLQMPLLILVFHVSPQASLDIVGWTCWLPSLIVVEAWMRWRNQVPGIPALRTA
jgi:uncharacterized membrane protein